MSAVNALQTSICRAQCHQLKQGLADSSDLPLALLSSSKSLQSGFRTKIGSRLQDRECSINQKRDGALAEIDSRSKVANDNITKENYNALVEICWKVVYAAVRLNTEYAS